MNKKIHEYIEQEKQGAVFLCCAVLSQWIMSDSGTPWTVAHRAPLSMGVLQARILEWVAMPSSRGSSQLRGQTQASCIADWLFPVWDTREAYLISKHMRLGLPWWSSGWLQASNSGDLSSVPSQGTRSHRPQLRVCMLQLRTCHSQIDKWIFKKLKSISEIFYN